MRSKSHQDARGSFSGCSLVARWATMALVVLLAGCAVEPARIEQARTLSYIPSVVGKILEFYQQKQPLGDQFALIDAPPGKSVLYIYREKRLVGSALIIPVRVDNIPLTNLQSGSFAVVIVDPGIHEIAFPGRIIPPGDLAFPGPAARARQIPDKRINVEVSVGTTVFLKGLTKAGLSDWSVEFEERPKANSLSEISSTRLAPMPSPDKELKPIASGG